MAKQHDFRRAARRPSSRPRLGQVFLTDRRVQQRILEALELTPNDTVLEVGAGPGNMTELLASRAGQVVTVEVDPRLLPRLEEKFGGKANVRIVHADILKVDIGEIARACKCEKMKVFGNLPYYITSPCLTHFFQFHTFIQDITVMVQEEVARRMVAAPGSSDYGVLSLTCRYYADPALLFSVGPKSFSPPPLVRSAVVKMNISPKRQELGFSNQDEPAFWSIVRAAFSQRRKTLFNNWKGIFDEQELHHVFPMLGIDKKIRAEKLSLVQFAELFRALSATGQIAKG